MPRRRRNCELHHRVINAREHHHEILPKEMLDLDRIARAVLDPITRAP